MELALAGTGELLPPWAMLIRERVRNRVTGGAARPVEVGGHRLERVLGSGGMGVVYAAREPEEGQLVALKMLVGVDPDRERLRREFRAASDLFHPNLVSLYQFGADEIHVYFTMELVVGQSFLEHVRSTEHEPHCDVRKLAGALSQICAALGHLHAHGLVHGDVKPQNCIVRPDGRLVVLDFGLASVTGENQNLVESQFIAGGTPNYMAPELFEGHAPTPASDLYALGAVIHHALYGAAPFAGLCKPELVRAKRSGPPHPSVDAEALPSTLVQLCKDLLSPKAGNRPSLEAIDAALGPFGSAPKPRPSAPPPAPPFVGRRAELARLSSAWERAEAANQCVVVDGRSGIGKSSLVRHFLSHHLDANGLVLQSRCYEREATPYQAFEGLVSDAVAYLQSLPAAEVRSLLPQNADVLVRAFPDLRRVAPEAVREARPAPMSADESTAQSRAANRALSELLANIARRRPTVLWIDDLQWADPDSALLLRGWLESAVSVPALTLLSLRTESWSTSECLRRVFPSGARSDPVSELIRLDALADVDALELTRAVGADTSKMPLDLAVHLLDSVGEVLDARLRTLSRAAQDLLNVAAIARGPLPIAVGLRACGTGAEWRSVVNELRANRLLRTDGPLLHDTMEVFHDRVREALYGRLDADHTRGIHSRLAGALKEEGGDDEALFFHYRHAGEVEEALVHAVAAAERAADALAFERAAAILRDALEIVSSAGEARRLRRLLGDMLRNAGHGPDAAKEYLIAAEGERSEEAAIDLQLLAARELLHAGNLPEAEALFSALYRRIGGYFPRTPYDALPGLLWNRIKIAFLRRRKRTIRRPDEIPLDSMMRMRASWSASHGMYMVDVVRGAKLSNDVYAEALATGHAFNLSAAEANEAINFALQGPKCRVQAERMLAQAIETGRRADEPFLPVWLDLMRAIILVSLGDLRLGIETFFDVEKKLSTDHVGRWSELSMCRSVLYDTLALAGDFSVLRDLLPVTIERAAARGHIYDSVMVRHLTSLLSLVEDRPEDAERELEVIDREWPGRGYQLAHHNRLLGTIRRLLYVGDSRTALSTAEKNWPRFRLSMWGFVEAETVSYWTMRGICAATAYRESGKPGLRRKAKRAIEALRRSEYPTARPTAETLKAAVAAADGRESDAIALYAAAATKLQTSERPVHAAAARFRLAELSRDDTVRQNAAGTLLAEGVRNPERFVRIYCP